MRYIYIKKSCAMQAAVVEDGKLWEFAEDSEADSDKAHSGDIYSGKVSRIVPGMKAAFVDIGDEKAGFLPLTELTKEGSFAKLQCGMQVVVQVKKEAHDQKGAFLSRDITLAGSYLLIMPCNMHLGISSRVTDEVNRGSLHTAAEKLRKRYDCGIVMRESALNASFLEMCEEGDRLHKIWKAVSAKAPTSHVPSLLYKAENPIDKLLEDYLPKGECSIFSNCSELLDKGKINEFGAPLFPWEEEQEKQWNKILSERDESFQRVLKLKCGGNIVVDECEAMTVIDVNTAKNVGTTGNLENTILETNLQACEEVIRVMSLRNLSGIIIVDSIDMENEDNRNKLLKKYEETAKKDREKVVIHGMTSLGLIEITRKRSGKVNKISQNEGE